MSDLDWDADDFEPPKQVEAAKPTDKWEGEDEDVDTKDNWDEDSDAEKSEKSEGTNDAPKKKKKNLAQIIAEKEKRQQEKIEERRKLAEEEKLAETPEQKLAEKLKMQKIQEDSDLLLAEELMGSGTDDKEESENNSLDTFELKNSRDLDSFRQALIKKIRSVDRLEKKPYFVSFVEDITRDFCLNLETDEIKRVTTVLNGIYNEKVKASKPTKGKKKGANKAKLNSGQGAITDSMGNDFNNEYDDFI